MFGPAPALVVEPGDTADEQGDIATGLAPLRKQFRHVFAADDSTAPVEHHGDLPRSDLREQPFFVGLTTTRRDNGEVQGTVGR